MKNIVTILALLVAASSFADPVGTNVAVHLGPVLVYLGPVSVHAARSNQWFDCQVVIDNQSLAPLTVTNLFAISPGLALKITDLDGNELKRTYAWPLKSWQWTLAPGTPKEFKRLMYGAKPGRTGNVLGISLPESVQTVRLQIEGTLSGSTYAWAITSNVVEVKISE